VTGRRAVTRAEILLLTSVHEDVMLEGFIGDRSEMVKCWIEKLEGNLKWGSESGGCFACTLDRDQIPESLPINLEILMPSFLFPLVGAVGLCKVVILMQLHVQNPSNSSTGESK
jgi:hypothetical protein